MFPPFRTLAEMISADGVDRVPGTSLYLGLRLSEGLAAGRIAIDNQGAGICWAPGANRRRYGLSHGALSRRADRVNGRIAPLPRWKPRQSRCFIYIKANIIENGLF
jgi:hypothetical protein